MEFELPESFFEKLPRLLQLATASAFGFLRHTEQNVSLHVRNAQLAGDATLLMHRLANALPFAAHG